MLLLNCTVSVSPHKLGFNYSIFVNVETILNFVPGVNIVTRFSGSDVNFAS